LDKNATYAVYCHSGNRSGAALEQMAAAGFTHLFDLAGGLTAWQAMGGHMVAGGP
ncbi:MAG TPA: rhodanese-like domain-containing protein, partial [Dermatophilaceae bacterium]